MGCCRPMPTRLIATTSCSQPLLPLITIDHLTLYTSSPHPPFFTPLVLPLAPVRIEAISTTTTSAVVEVELSPEGTPPMIVVMELTSHPELGCCGNQTTYVRGGSVEVCDHWSVQRHHIHCQCLCNEPRWTGGWETTVILYRLIG